MLVPFVAALLSSLANAQLILSTLDTLTSINATLDRDIVFVFGAGASYGAGSILPEQPPLGKQLYSELARVYPGSWGRLPRDVRDAFRKNFEEGMQIIYDRWGGDIPALMREMAVYFIQFRPYNNATLYCRLIQDLNSAGLLSRTLFSTLNYECVLEYSLVQQGHPISYFDFGNEDAVPVWKLHGSCNMFSRGVEAGRDILYGTGVSWEGGIEAFLDSDRVIQRCLVETGLAPVMCLYMRGKIVNVSPSAILDLQRRWQDTVSGATAVFCVGVRPVAEDTHIWDTLSSSSASLHLVGDKEDLLRWSTERQRAIDHLGSRFNLSYALLIERLKSYAAN